MAGFGLGRATSSGLFAPSRRGGSHFFRRRSTSGPSSTSRASSFSKAITSRFRPASTSFFRFASSTYRFRLHRCDDALEATLEDLPPGLITIANLTDLPRPGIVSRERLALLPDQWQRLLESPDDEIVVHVVRSPDVGKCLEHPLLPPGEGINVSEEVRRYQRRRRRLLRAAGNQEQQNRG